MYIVYIDEQNKWHQVGTEKKYIYINKRAGKSRRNVKTPYKTLPKMFLLCLRRSPFFAPTSPRGTYVLS